MRIQFLKPVIVDINTTPRSAWGRLQIVTPQVLPNFIGESRLATKPEWSHCFPAGAVVDMPDEIAAGYVEAGSAKVYINPRGAVLFGVERPPEVVK